MVGIPPCLFIHHISRQLSRTIKAFHLTTILPYIAEKKKGTPPIIFIVLSCTHVNLPSPVPPHACTCLNVSTILEEAVRGSEAGSQGTWDLGPWTFKRPRLGWSKVAQIYIQVQTGTSLTRLANLDREKGASSTIQMSIHIFESFDGRGMYIEHICTHLSVDLESLRDIGKKRGILVHGPSMHALLPQLQYYCIQCLSVCLLCLSANLLTCFACIVHTTYLSIYSIYLLINTVLHLSFHVCQVLTLTWTCSHLLPLFAPKTPKNHSIFPHLLLYFCYKIKLKNYPKRNERPLNKSTYLPT